MLPGRFVYSTMPCLSCGGGPTVLNGPVIVDAEHSAAFERGEATLIAYVCSVCSESWGFYGSRDPEGPSYETLLEAVT